MTISESLQHLAALTKGGVALHFRDGKFHVECDVGNQMWVVPASIKVSAEAAVESAVVAWERRSPEKPFIPGSELFAAVKRSLSSLRSRQ